MPFEGAVAEAYEALTPRDQIRVAELVFQLANDKKKREEDKKQTIPFNVFKGQIEIFDNFDDSLPEFEEYM